MKDLEEKENIEFDDELGSSWICKIYREIKKKENEGKEKTSIRVPGI
jgi:hypothetical protein